MRRAALVLIAGCGRISFDAQTDATITACAPATSIAAINVGERHVCMLDDTNAVYCAGANPEGAFGDGTHTSSTTWVRSLMPRADRLVTGLNYTCALDSGSVWCWGAGNTGQLGVGFLQSGSEIPMQVSLASVSGVEAYFLNACANLLDGSLWCWGGNQHGQLADGTKSSSGTPKRVTMNMLPLVDELAEGGRQHLCIRSGGSVWCWGQDDAGQVGDMATADRTTPFQIPTANLDTAVQVTVGNGVTCARKSDNTTVCLGRGVEGRLGDGTGANRAVPTEVVLPEPLVEIDAGGNHVCGRTATNRMLCWGSNDYGQIGDGTRTDRLAPVYVDAGDVIAISAGQFITCALRSDHSAACWGDNENGALSNGQLSSVRAITQVLAPAKAIVDINAGAFATCASNDNGVFCTGDNQYGQVGDGTFDDRDTFTQVLDVPPGSRLGACSSCLQMCAVTPAAEVMCWGYGETGGLGDGKRNTSNRAIIVPGLPGVVSVAVGDTHACAIKTDGTLWCWGANGSGQVGTLDNSQVNTPVEIAGLPGPVTAVAGAAQHACAISLGQLYCWGEGESYRRGDNNQMQHYAPTVRTGVVSNYTAVALGEVMGCALDANKDLFCWGAGGRAGINITGDVPTPMLALGGVTQVDGAATHMCAVKADGTAWCWGDCTRGKCGPQSEGIEQLPRQIAGVTDAVFISAGETHSCIKHATGAVSCFGGNTFGQLGLAPVITRTPTPVCKP